MRCQRSPARLSVARPDPAAVTSGPGVAVSVEAPGANVRAIDQRPFVIATMPCQPSLDGKFIAVIRPPAIHAESEIIVMPCPVVVDVEGRGEVLGGRRTRIAAERGAEQIPGGVIDVEDHLEIEIVQRLDLFGRMRKGIRIEFERAVTRVPAVCAVAGPEIDERIAGKLFFTESLRDLQGLFRPRQGAMRLNVTHRPFWRHYWMAGD